MTLPNFIIIGAMKTGTTSLHRYLEQHPDVCVSSIKETDFFLGEEAFAHGLDWYESLFERDVAAVGEASPNYTKRHLWSAVPERIAAVVPDVKLIYVVREPIERLVSHYIHNYSHGRENRSIDKALMEEPGYLLTSSYAHQLDPFIERFGVDRILVLDSADLDQSTATSMRTVFDHLSVTNRIADRLEYERHHSSDGKRRRSIVDRRIPIKKVRGLLRLVLPRALTDPRPIGRPEISATTHDMLVERLRPDIDRFRSLTGKPFAEWSV
ncbi:MAG: sulfotransferase [Actinomycetota bacterium]